MDGELTGSPHGPHQSVESVDKGVKPRQHRERGVERPVASGRPNSLVVVNVLVDALSDVVEKSEEIQDGTRAYDGDAFVLADREEMRIARDDERRAALGGRGEVLV